MTPTPKPLGPVNAGNATARKAAWTLFVWTLLLPAWAASGWAQSLPQQLHTFFRERVKLNQAEIRRIEEGEIVTKLLKVGDKTNVLVFGAVYVDAPVEEYLKIYRKVEELEQEEVFVAVQRFSTPPRLADLARFELEKKDIDRLKKCKAGDCDVQILDPERIRNAIDWKSPNAYAAANSYARRRIIEGLKEYQSGGLAALGSYRDMKNDLNLYQAMKAMVDQSGVLTPGLAPKLYRHLLDYPDTKLEGAEDFFFWEKLDFDLDVTVRVNHATMYRVRKGVDKYSGAATHVVANKQLWASHYFRVALELYACFPDAQRSGKRGFFLVSINNSRLPNYGRLKQMFVRKIASRKGMEAAHDILAIVQKRLTEARIRSATPK